MEAWMEDGFDVQYSRLRITNITVYEKSLPIYSLKDHIKSGPTGCYTRNCFMSYLKSILSSWGKIMCHVFFKTDIRITVSYWVCIIMFVRPLKSTNLSSSLARQINRLIWSFCHAMDFVPKATFATTISDWNAWKEREGTEERDFLKGKANASQGWIPGNGTEWVRCSFSFSSAY